MPTKSQADAILVKELLKAKQRERIHLPYLRISLIEMALFPIEIPRPNRPDGAIYGMNNTRLVASILHFLLLDVVGRSSGLVEGTDFSPHRRDKHDD